ncbi:MAG: class F sortase [Actinomycetota bacterium]|nr:class F sortase [Actinomycetota bacterium]
MPPAAPDQSSAGGVGRRRRVPAGLAVALAVALALVGTGMVGYGLSSQRHPPPQPSVALAPPHKPSGEPAMNPAPTAPAPTVAVALPPATPTTIRIPAIGVSSPVNVVGLNPDKTLQVPRVGPLYDQAAWYRYSPTPGETGPSVIIGHVDSARNGPSVFYRLGALTPGQQVQVGRADGGSATFEVDSVASYPKDSFPQLTVYGPTTQPALRLITCGGSFDRATLEYRNNTVVFAHLVASTAPTGTTAPTDTTAR